MAWPKSIADRAKAVEAALATAPVPMNAAQFARAKEKDVQEILDTLVALARAHQTDRPGFYVR